MKKIFFLSFCLLGLFLFPSKAQVVSYDFENITQDANWHFVNQPNGNGWFIGSAANVNHTPGGSRSIYVSNDNGTTNTYSETTSASWAYVDIAIPTGYVEFTLEFDWKCYGEGSDNSYSPNDWDYMKVYVGTPSLPTGDAQPVGTEALTNDLKTIHQTCFNGCDGFQYVFPGWNHYSYTFSGTTYGGQTIRLYLFWANDDMSSFDPPMAVDNITLTGSNCGTVSNITAMPSVSELAVTFSPAQATDNAWEYVCVLKGASIVDETPVSISDTSFTINNLLSNIEYDVYIRTDCGTENSNWKKKTFRTTCAPIATIPYYENFDSIEPGGDAFPDCWYKLNTYDGWGVWPHVDYQSYEGSGALAFYAYPGTYNIAIMPAMDASIAINTLMASFMFKYRYADNENYILVGVMDDPEDANTFVTVDTVRTTLTNTWVQGNASFGNYTGTGHHIAFKNETGRLFLDNLSIDFIPSCISPAGVTVSHITATDATVSWTPRGTENVWEVIVVPSGTDPETATPEPSDADSLNITGLQGDASYQVYVRADCGENGYSEWTFPVTFHTDCPDFLTLPYTQNFDSYESEDYPTCWHRLYNNQWGIYPNLSITHSSSGTSSLYFYAETNGYNIAIAPAIDTLANPINSIAVSFKQFKTWAPYGDCELGVMTDPTDASTFTTVATVSSSDLQETDTWGEFDFPLSNYTGFGNYIALRATAGTNPNNNVFYIDDVVIYEVLSCLKPMDITLSQISSNGAVVDWTPRNDESAWKVVVVPTGNDPETATPAETSVHPFTISGLTANTTYDIYVQADCGDGNLSAWSTVVTFTTLCTPLAVTLPYSENFNSCETGEDAALPECWLKYNNTNTAYPYPDDQYTSPGTKAMYFYAEPDKYSYLTSRSLDLSQFAAGSLHLSFKLLKYGTSYGRMDVGFMTDPGDMNTFVLLKAVYPSDYAESQTWYSWDIPIFESFAAPVCLAFLAPAGDYNYVYLDDVVLDNVPECSAPSDLQISAIQGTSALVSWTASPYGNVDYTIEYSETGTDNWTAVSNIDDTRILLSGLTQTTSYDVRGFANCADGNTSDTIVGTFVTGCLAGGDITIGTGTDENTEIPLNAFYNYNYTQQIFEAAELNGATLIKGIKFDYASNSQTLFPMTHKNTVIIYLAHTTKSTFTSETDWIPINSAVQVYSGNLNCSQGWNTFMFDTSFAYNGNDNLVLIVDDNSNANDGYGHYFHTHCAINKSLACKFDYDNPDPANPPADADDITLCNYRSNVIFMADCDSIVTCIAPNVLITAVDDQSITLEWVPGDQEDSWEIEYKFAADSVWTPAGTVTISPHVLSGLTSGSDYMVRMRSVCTPDYSNWVTLSFITECPPITVLPFTENFDADPDTDDNYFADCWTKGTNSNIDYPHTDNQYAYSAPNSLYFFASPTIYSYAATPRFDETVRMDSLTVSFSMYESTEQNTIEVGIMTDPYDYETFVPVGTATPTNKNVWELTEINTARYAGTGHFVAFRIPQWRNNSLYIDNVTIQYLPGCARINDLTVNNITPNSATIEWSAGEDESVWEYLYGEAGTVDLTTAVPMQIYETSITLTGLTDNTSYDVYVRGMCPNGEFSPWTNIRFKTACLAITIPYSYDFDADATGNYAAFPDCWYRIYTGTSSEPFPYVSDLYSHSGNNSLFYYSGYFDGYALLPYVDVTVNPINTLQLSFYARTFVGDNYTSYIGKVIVGVMENAESPNTFIPVDTVDIASEIFEEYRVLLNHYQGTGSHVTLKFPKPGGNINYNKLFLDDIFLNTIPACPRPSDLTVMNVDNHTATLSWRENGTATEWEIKYGFTGFDPATTGTTITATTNPLTIIGLTANANYDFYVRSACSNTEYSEWSPKVTCTTQCDVITTFPHTEGFENGGNMPDCWSQEQISGNKNWTFKAGNHISGDIGNAHSGNFNAYLWNGSSYNISTTKLISPTFDLTQLTNPYISFWHSQQAWESDQDILKIYYRTDNTTAWTLIVDYTSNIFYWKYDSLPLPNPSATYQIAFEGVGTYGFGITLDDITIDEATGATATCDAPTGLSTNATTTTATLSWAEMGNFEVAYKKTSTADWSANLSVTGNTTTITGLTPGTNYDWRVRQVCDDTIYSDWTTSTFQTSEEATCPMPTNLTITDITNNSATLNWEQEGDVFEWTLNYKRADASDWTNTNISTKPYTITDLSANTDYEAKIRANCADGMFSEYTNSVTFKTTVGIEDYAPASSLSLYPNPTSANIDVMFARNLRVSELKVYDVYGKLLQTVKVNENPTRINVSGLADGVYFVRAITEKGIANKSFIKR